MLLVAFLVVLVRLGAAAPVRAVALTVDDELARAHASADVVEFYQAREMRPFWVRSAGLPPFWTRGELRPEALQMAKITADALPAEVTPAARARVAQAMAAARSGRPEDLARAEVALSLALVDAVDSLRPGPEMAFVDPDLPTRPGALETLEQAASVRELNRYLANVAVPNPVYRDLRAAYDRYRGPDAALIQLNLQRARVLPPPTSSRFILVNPAARELTVYEDGKAKQSMRVIVGTREDATPMMAGLMRYLVFNPYWEIPVEMVKESIAPAVMRQGPGYVANRNFQVLSDWGDDAVPLDPAAVDWPAVAGGAVELPVRQKPGGDNMMGQVKFMLPNELGIYLHDTPDRWAFGPGGGQRLMSAGCVRLERAGDLVAWLLGKDRPDPAKVGSNHRVELGQAVPVYITYLTAAPGKGGVVFHPDVYGRDVRPAR